MPDSNSIIPKSLVDQGEVTTPEDVATLYSWANLHGAKYRDFSVSRAQAREEARLRVEEALAEEKRRHEEEAERRAQEEAQIAARLAAEAAEAARQAEAERLAEIARQAEAERQAVLAAQEAQRHAARNRVWQPAPPEAYKGSFVPFSVAGNPLPQSGYYGIGTPDPASSMAASQPFNQPPARVQGMNSTVVPAFSPVASNAPSHPNKFHPNSRVSEYAPAQPDPSGQAAPSQPHSSPTASPNSFQNPAYPPPSSSFPDYPAFALPQYPAESYAWSQQGPYAPSPWNPTELRELREQRESREPASRPAWLAPELPYPPASQPSTNQAPLTGQYPGGQSQVPSQAKMPVQTQDPMYDRNSVPGPSPGAGSGQAQPPGQNSGLVDDTPLGSRDRIANRWYALKSVFDPQPAPLEQVPAQPPARVPVLAVFSLAGGVGKTSLVASLGRALSSRGERILLVDTAAYGLLPFFFGARDQRPGMLRTFNPPGVSADAPIQLVTLDPEGQPPAHLADANQPDSQGDPLASNPANQDWLAQEVARYTRSANRVLIDLPTASGSTTRRVLRLAPVILVPVLPDMNSVVSVGAIESFFRHNGTGVNTGGKQIMPYYVLNQFDYSLPLHLDVRDILREQIGDRLLPFALRRSAAVSEALAEGMTVMDYAPNAVVAEDYANLAGWVRSLSAPATQSYRGVRWSER